MLFVTQALWAVRRLSVELRTKVNKRSVNLTPNHPKKPDGLIVNYVYIDSDGLFRIVQRGGEIRVQSY